MLSPRAQLVSDLLGRNWAVDRAFASAPQVQRLSAEAQRLWQAGAFHAAGIGHHGERHAEVRSDQVLWLEQGITPRH